MSIARLKATAARLSDQLIAMPRAARRSQLNVLRRWNPRLYAYVVDRMNRLREAAIQGDTS